VFATLTPLIYRPLCSGERRFDRRSGRDLAALDPRSLVAVFGQRFEQITRRAERLNADLEQ